MKSALVALFRAIGRFLKYDNGRAIDQLGWSGILRNLGSIAKVAYGKNPATGHKTNLGNVFPSRTGGWGLSMEANLYTTGRWLVLPVKRLVAESAVFAAGIGGLIAGVVFGARAIAKEGGEGGEEPATVDPEGGTADFSGREKWVEVEVGGPNAAYWQPMSDGSKGRTGLDGSLVNVIGSPDHDVIRAAEGVDQANIFDGGDGNDRLDGGLGDDLLIGGAGNDTLLGGAGDDILVGGAGADVLDGGAGEDFADYSESDAGVVVDLSAGTGRGGDAEGDRLANIEHIIGSAHADVLIGQNGDVDNIFFGGGGDDRLEGRGGDDMLFGEDGNDRLYGGAGDDLLVGGAGADVIDGGEGEDFADYGDSAAGVTIDLSAGSASGGDAEGDTLSGIEHIIGTEYDDVLIGQDDKTGNIFIGGAGDDRLEGRGGDDVLAGGAGADVIDGGEGNDLADYTGSDAGVNIDLAAGTASGGHAEGDRLAAIEHLVGSDHDDVLAGDDGINMIGGGAGNDTIEGRGGDDLLTGGAGNDQLFGGEGHDVLLGDAGSDLLRGGAGDDVLVGGAWGDILYGDDGQDTVSYAESEAGVSVDLATGEASGGDATGDVFASIEHLSGSAHDDVLAGDAVENVLAGGAGNDTLSGREGDDILVGGAGADRLDGGSGVDWAGYGDSASGVTVDLAAGTGTSGDAAGDTLTGIENVSGSAYSDRLTGDANANWLDGGAGYDRLKGGGGADRLDGGEGIDTADYTGSSAGVHVDLMNGTSAGGDAEGDVLSSIENLIGSDHADRLVGDAGANDIQGGAGDDHLEGGAGDDRLVGGAGADRLAGGEGTDTVDYNDAFTGGIHVDLAAGIGSGGEAEGDTFAGIENLRGTVFADTLIGDGATNRLDGGGGNDTIDGGAGDDVLIGGQGADRIEGGAGIDTADYSYSAGGVTVDLSGGPGAGGDAEGDVLSGIENVTGSMFDDTLRGNEGANRLDGGAGSDTADYSTSRDGVRVDLGTGAASGGDATGDTLSSIENLTGSDHADRLTGDAGANRLTGGGGDDVLIGGGGNDVLVGGAGNDSFVFSGDWGFDTIADFTEGDKILLDAESYAELESALAGAVQHNGATGPYVVLWFELSGRTITILDTELSSLSLDDFGIAPKEAVPGQVLVGTEGADQLIGGAGDDTIAGSAGADLILGGEGTDTVDYSASQSGVQVELYVNRGTKGDAEGDILSEVENLIGSSHADWLAGNDASNRIEGGAGDDIIAGGGGDDVLVGGAGADMLFGDDGHDTVDYSGASAGIVVSLDNSLTHQGEATGDYLAHIEVVIGTAHDDVIKGDAAANHLLGGAGNDRLEGDFGNDVLSGGAGADHLDGGTGSDTADYTASSAGVTIDLTTGTAAGGDAAGDFLSGIENLAGSNHADRLTGDAGANRLTGNAGEDVLTGGAGDDLLEGGADHDSFVFSGDWGRDTIADFEAGDKILLDTESYAQLESALANASEQYNPATGVQTTLHFDFTGRSITFQNTARAELTTDDFGLTP